MCMTAPIIQLSSQIHHVHSSVHSQEEKKILYYHPAEVDLDTKIRDVGLVEAISKFTE